MQKQELERLLRTPPMAGCRKQKIINTLWAAENRALLYRARVSIGSVEVRCGMIDYE